MKSAWETKKLGDVCERVSVGHVGITTPFYSNGGVLFLRTQNVGDAGLVLDDTKFVTPAFHATLKKSEVRAGDVLMSRVITNTVRCALIPEGLGPANCANVVLVRPAAGLMPEFLAHYIRSSEAQRHLLDRKVGSAQLVVNTTVVRDWPVPIPSPDEQRRIVDVLDKAFAGIATAKANARKCLQNARDLFESTLQSAFAKRGKSWTDRRLGDVLRTGSGGTPLKSKKEYYEGGSIPWLMSGEVSQGEVTSATKFITPKGLENSSARVFPKNTVLVAMYGATAGEVGILRFEASTNQAVCGVLPSDAFYPEFLFYVLLSKNRELVDQATGNAQPNISQIKIKNTEIPIVALTEQKVIVKTLDAVREETQQLESIYQRKLAALDALKQSLLHQAFSGQL